MTQTESKPELATLICDECGDVSIGSYDEPCPRCFPKPADAPRIVAECRVCDWTGSEQAALDHFESTDHDCDVRPVRETKGYK